MLRYAGLIGITTPVSMLIDEILECKKFLCEYEKSTSFSTRMFLFDEEQKQINSNSHIVYVATARMCKTVSGRFKFQVSVFECNQLTHSEKFMLLKNYDYVFGEHEFILNNTPAVLKVYRKGA